MQGSGRVWSVIKRNGADYAECQQSAGMICNRWLESMLPSARMREWNTISSWKVVIAGTMQDTKFRQAVIWDQSMGLSLLCFLKNVQMIGECCQTGLLISLRTPFSTPLPINDLRGHKAYKSSILSP